MAGRFVRSSKYRHVFGRSTKKEQCYDNLRISKNAWDTNLIKANPEYISVNWEASGGGAFAVIPVNERGKLPEQLPLFRGHTAAVLDTDWNPFNDSIIASGSDDCKVFIWKVPENFSLYSDAEEPEDVSPVSRFTGHSRKVGHVLFNPSAANVLASSAGDYTVKLWDIEAGQAKLNLKHPDIVQSLSWSANGSLLVTTARDKKLRIWDTRQEKPAHEGPGHSGAKNSRAVWMGEHDRIATTGFSRMSDRQLGLWDIKNPKEPIGGFQILDQISGVCMPFWDDGTKCLYLAGKGDGNIRYYEYENDKFEYLSEYKSADPQRGIAFLPKRGINLHDNEVMRAYKTVADSYIEPISFIVPRRAEVFQNDIYPPTVGIKPGLSAADWFGGKEALPPKIDLESVYDGGAPKELPADYKPPQQETPAPTPAVTKTEAPKPATAPEPEPTPRDPSKGMQDNKASMAAMADRFADKGVEKEESSGDESFEEIPKPVERPSVVAARGGAPKQEPSPITSSASAAKPIAADPPTSTPTPAPAAASTGPTSPPSTASPAKATPSASGAAEGLKAHLQDIKESQSRLMAMMEAQNRTMASQSVQINSLTEEVESLKAKVGGGAGASSGGRDDRDEKIRRLELELEEYRS